MTAMMEPEEDYLTIVEAEEKIKASRTKKEKEIEEAHANLKGASPSAWSAYWNHNISSTQ